MKRSLWLTILCLISICTISHAQISLKTYQQMPAADVRKNETFQAYINGLGRGYEWANTALEHKKQAKLFCVPGKLGLRAENYIDILDAQQSVAMRAVREMAGQHHGCSRGARAVPFAE